jgi:integrase
MPRQTRRSYGAMRRLPSGRYQASHVGPDGHRHPAPDTFATKGDADAWLAAQRTDIIRGDWRKPLAMAKVPTFTECAESWLETRTLTPRTRGEYRKLLAGHLLPTFGRAALDDITPVAVRTWHAGLAEVTGPTRRAHAYGLLRTILATAVTDDIIDANPCRIRGAGTTKRAKPIRPATLDEIAAITEAMPDRYQAAVLVAAWCGLRFGELAELRRKDVDLTGARLRIRRGVTNVSGENIVGAPKTEAGMRDVAIPPHLIPVLRAHLLAHTLPGRDGLLFSAPDGRHLRSDGALHRAFRHARTGAGRSDLTVHGLRHTGATLAAATGATLAELMHRLGHTTPGAAMRYQHAASDRDAAIAEALSKFHTAGVVELGSGQVKETSAT